MAARDERRGRRSPEPAVEAVLSLLRAADRCRRYVATVLRPAGITLQQFNVLRILRGAGPGGLPTLEVGERMIEKTPGVTRLLDRLEARGWVRRWRDPEDRRVVLATITEPGLELLAELDAPVLAADRRCVATFSAEEMAELECLAERVLESDR